MLCWNSAPCASNHFNTSSSTLKVTAVFPFGIRHSAAAKNSSSSDGISEVSISSSVMLSMRAQSVSESFFKSLSLMFQCLPQRDNPYCLFAAFGKNYYDCSVSQKTDSNPTIFAIIRSRIKSNTHGSSKDFPCIGEV